jgi:hypothetical protein
MGVKMNCNWCHLLVCSSPSCKLQLSYLDQFKLLSKNSRTRDVNVDDTEIGVLQLLSVGNSPTSDLRALFEHVTHIFMA